MAKISSNWRNTTGIITQPVWSGLRWFLNLLDRVIYPPVCVGCSVICEKHSALCSQCWSELHFIDRPFCDITGRPFSHDLGEGIISADAIANPPPYRRARAAIIYDGKARKIVHRFKFKDQSNLSHLMADWMIRAGQDCIKDADFIIPVPLHRWRLISRKYNQSADLARLIGQKVDLAYLPSILLRQRHTKPQVGLAASERQKNVKGAFKVLDEKRSDILGSHIVLVDDVFTTGATVNAATKALLKAGAREVSVLTFARVGSDI